MDWDGGEMVQEIIQNILVYVVMTAVLRGLVSNKGFLEIFRFVSGLILILLFAGPVVSIFSSENSWYRQLEENIFEVDYRQMEQEMAIAQGQFENILYEECRIQIRQQVKELIQQEGLQAERVRVEIVQKGEEILIKEIQAKVKKASNQEKIVEQIKIDLGDEQEKYRKTDKETKLLQKRICEKFELKKEEVKVWKENGENG